MTDDQSHQRDVENRARFARRRAERAMAAEERELKRGIEALEDDIAREEHQIDGDLRDEHWGRDPERPPSWHTRPDGGD